MRRRKQNSSDKESSTIIKNEVIINEKLENKEEVIKMFLIKNEGQ